MGCGPTAKNVSAKISPQGPATARLFRKVVGTSREAPDGSSIAKLSGKCSRIEYGPRA